MSGRHLGHENFGKSWDDFDVDGQLDSITPKAHQLPVDAAEVISNFSEIFMLLFDVETTELLLRIKRQTTDLPSLHIGNVRLSSEWQELVTFVYTLSHRDRECGQFRPCLHKNFENSRWFRPRRAVGFDRRGRNRPSGSKSSRIFQNFHAHRDGTVHTLDETEYSKTLSLAIRPQVRKQTFELYLIAQITAR